jgi:hypothetical protein
MPNYINFGTESPIQQTILGSDPELQQKQRMAQLLLQMGLKQERPKHWSEGLANALNVYMGNRRSQEVTDELKTQTSKYQTDMASMLAGGQPGNWTNPDTGVNKEYGGGYQGMIDKGLATHNPALQDKIIAIQLEQAKNQAALMQAREVAKVNAASRGGSYGTTPQFTPEGKAYVIDKNGNIKYLDGIAPPREKLNFGDTGGSSVGRDPYTGEIKSSTPNTVSPNTKFAQDEIWNRHQTPSPKAPGAEMTEGRAKAAGFEKIAHDASTVIDEIEKGPYLGSDEHKKDLTTEWFGTPHINMGAIQVPSIKPMHMLGMTSDTGKRYEQAKHQWLSSVMYKFSGAEIKDSEFARLDGVYFPQRNDDPETIKQKTAARQSVLSALQIGSGKEYEQIKNQWTATTGQPASTPAPGPERGTAQGSSDVIAHHEKFGDITQADLELTAKEEGITVAEVKRRLGIK